MTEYKILSKKLFTKESAFLDNLNNVARNGWKIASVGYNEGHISKVILERNK